ncbi:Cytochrome P450 monooxygenase [Pseudocercospora fuligena]|uniref:Cytochrome P450 monooxygenase n=1 Tax=Pseudocercospora fuligena TaxID=685502 RepID=A0A8H6R5Q0_9PEZI|nr:Cytochrome P450 monooxygenase [Pseudocercospora fuligena]
MDTSSAAPISFTAGFAMLALLYVVGNFIYKLYFGPLSHIPGPKLNAVSRLPYIRHLLKGTTVDNVNELHEKYGEVVRLSPNEVSFTSADTAWPDIYGFRTGKMKGHLNTQKDPAWYPPPMNGVPSLILADDDLHSKGRRILSHAFSEKALADQEGLLQGYVDQLVVKAFRMYYISKYWPWVKSFGSMIIDKSLMAKRMDYLNWVSKQVKNRIERDTQRPDFMTLILQHNGEKGYKMEKGELDSNANLMLTAGSETTASLLGGATYCLLTNPAVLQKLTEEVRGKWKSYDDINLHEVNNSPYLVATMNEALRYFPPVPTGFERKIGAGGETVSGYYLPEGTSVCISQYPAHHSEKNFKNAEQFVPERWMGDEQYKDDKRSGMQPFSFGPRNCLGKNLAYAEMRLIMAKMIWSFDMQLESQSRDWIQRCKVHTLWDKPALMVRLTEVVR